MKKQKIFFSFFLIIAFVCIAPLAAQVKDAKNLNPAYTILIKARENQSDSEALFLLQQNLAQAGNLSPWFIHELIIRSAATGNWKQALIWAERQDLTSVPKELRDSFIWWYGQSLIKNAKETQAISIYYEFINSGLCADPSIYLAYFTYASEHSALFLKKFDASFPQLKYNDPECFMYSRYLAGLCAVREGDWNFVIDIFSYYADTYKGQHAEYSAWVDYYLAYSLYRLGKFPQAIQSFELYLEQWPSHSFNWQAAMTASSALIQIQQDPLPMVDRALQLSFDNEKKAETIIFKSSILMDQKDYEKAEKILKGVADGGATNGRTNSSARAFFMLGEIRSRLRDYEQAEAYWVDLTGLYPKDSLAEEAVFRIGEMWYVSGNLPRSLRYFTQYRQSWLNGVFLSSVLRNGGDAHSQTGAIDLAILWWEELIRKFPQSSAVPKAYTELIKAYKSKHEYDAALWTAEKYMREYPKEAQLDDILSEIALLTRYKNGENPSSYSLFVDWTRAKKAETASGRALGIRLAREYLTDYSTKDQAEPVLLEITKTMPKAIERLSGPEKNTYASAWSLLGTVHREKGSYTKASQELLQAGTLFAYTDGEKAAEALYASVDCFIQARMNSDAVAVYTTMKNSWGDSLWTARAGLLLESLDIISKELP